MKIREIFDGNKINWEKVEKLSEFKILSTTPQSSIWHKEGDVLTHTKLVVDKMYEYFINNNLPLDNDYYYLIMTAALCHDLGKANTTKWDDTKNDYSTKRHGAESAVITRKLFYDEDVDVRENLVYMVRYHMTLHHIFDNEDETLVRKKIASMSYGRVPLKDMIILNICDSRGSINDYEDEEFLKNKENRLIETANNLGCYTNPMELYGKHVAYFLDIKDKFSKEEEFKVYIMIGIPGSGKDTYIKTNLSTLPVICRDDIRTEIGLKGDKPMGNKKQESYVTEIFEERMKKYTLENQSFVINNTNVKKSYRDDYRSKILTLRPNAKFIYVYVEAPSIKVNKERRKGQMPLEVIDRMLNQLEFPYSTEYNELIISKQIEK